MVNLTPKIYINTPASYWVFFTILLQCECESYFDPETGHVIHIYHCLSVCFA